MIENLRAAAPQRVNLFFCRTTGGAEIDLLLEISPRRKIAIEIKRSLSPTLSKGFHLGCEAVKANQRYVVYPGKERYPMTKDIEVMPLIDMMSELKRLSQKSSGGGLV
ncbi:MAG: hypothetical protein WCD70_13745 [Alphaproteobacteria bacterium]